MEGRFPRGGLSLTFANCGNPSAEAEMNAWWEHVRIPDVTRAGIFHSATRFINRSAAGTPDDPRYLTVYETDWTDVSQALSENNALRSGWRVWNDEHVLHPSLVVARQMLFKRHGRNPIAFAGSTPRGLIVNLSDCADPERETEFNWWYDYRRSFDILLTSFVTSVTRYRNVGAVEGQPKYLTLYETQLPGQEALEGIRKVLGGSSRRLDIAITRYGAAFDLIFSETAERTKSGV